MRRRSKDDSDQPDNETMKDSEDKNTKGNTGTYRDKETMYRALLRKMKMDPYETKNLTLQDILQIDRECLQKIGDGKRKTAAWNFIRKIISLNETARKSEDESEDLSGDSDDETCDSSNSVHPLDVQCLVLHCCDHFLQQEIILKMSMCQFAVPLLLPDVDGPGCTFMLWGMRDIVKRWRPQSLAETKGYVQENLVQISMPNFSFVRLGESTFSKSYILNLVLSQAQQTRDFFVYRDMEGADVTREISEGLVELSWYFPAGKSHSEMFPEPVAFANLRGNLEDNLRQFAFLTQISSAVFIFVQKIDQNLYDFLTKYEDSQTNFVFVIKSNSKINIDTHLKNVTLLKFKSNANGATIVKGIFTATTGFINKRCRVLSLEDMSEIASKLGISVDENVTECQNAKADAKAITDEIKDVAEYKNNIMRLQGNLWKKLSELEKEMCQMKKQGDKHGESYKLELQKQCADIREQQYKYKIPNGIISFINSVLKKNHIEKCYFFKWLRFYLDSSARKNLSALQAEYKEKSVVSSKAEMSELDQKISTSSLGIEHFIRELSQFYEAEHFMLKHEIANKRKLIQLPAFAADLLLSGFPLELIDGDASNIPLQWLQDVLHELDNKTGKCCRMGVITVLGVQSTGKSTLLNTMFGLQFPVSSGRCTRGAFMTLMKVSENFQAELGCEFILVIDTEGLRAPELTSLENSYEHDNELATLVVGLSDITIVNMSMENTTEMKDILQIVVHAFLRMKEIGRKPNCHFVHQNVSDVSAHENNSRDRIKLLEHLNGMTKIAANMEKKIKFTAFSDIMKYDPDKDSFYIPGLWNGVPPMASINTAYSEAIYELKKYLIESMKNKGHRIDDFIEWIKSLWNAVKHENFIFSFRNSLVANAYNQLSKKYSELEWKFTKSILNWLAETETVIKNQNEQMADSEGTKCTTAVYSILSEEEKNMQEELEKYFSSDNKDASLIERYKAEFLTSVSCLRKKLESSSLNKCAEIIRIKKENFKVRNVISAYKQVIDKKVTSLVMKFREEKCKPNEKTLEEEFELMWAETISELNVIALPEPNIELNLLAQLKKEMAAKGSSVNQRLNNLKQFIQQEKLHLHESQALCLFNHVKRLHILDSAAGDKLEEFLKSLSDKCSEYIKNKLSSESDYDETYGLELLNIINLVCDEDKDLQISADIELELKLFILGNALGDFQQMHKEFVKKNDPLIGLGEMKPKYWKSFQYRFQEKNESWERAKYFCELWLKPALIKQVNRKLGNEIVDHILQDCQSNQFSTRMYFQFTVMKYLLEKTHFSDYLEYISDYETFVKKWINNYIIEKCDFHHMQSVILSNITKKIKDILNENSQETSDFLVQFKERLKRDLILSDDMDVFHLKEDTNIKEFVENLEKSLSDTEAEIISEMKAADKETILSNVVVKPVDELFKRIFGCGKQCPFCKAPCEAGGTDHKSHFASIHRPTGLGKYRIFFTQALCYDICTTNISGNKSFKHQSGSSHPYKEYRTVNPDWDILPDPSIEASDYWKYVLKEFNEQFAEEYEANPAEYPEEWNRITKEQAEKCLNAAFCMESNTS
ncbi:up-regulator of cell proliferation isoform X2 [Xenopus laevis]|uniref:Up-regulator of cell proliferation isoform X2 n=1 Tax=Xenopus laevis TaxID=8355 RepID=A0A8J1LVD5_XENLA|nr:up-regulator of cell proliferation isoform X2 [Xenopus laevis]